MSVMDDILSQKKVEIAEFKNLHGENLFTGKMTRRSFREAVGKEDSLSLITEIKRKSPSHGAMGADADPVEIAKIYTSSGADAISVLTDSKFFGGSFEFLKSISGAVAIPLLCKDFVIDPIQIDLAKLSGASAVLLITDILSDSDLERLYLYAGKIGLDALVEAHHPENVKRAAAFGPEIIGINNRNLFTLEEDLRHSERMREFLPEGSVKLSLSSVQCREDAEKVASWGYDGVLAGAVFMKAFNKRAAVHSFTGIGKTVQEAAVEAL